MESKTATAHYMSYYTYTYLKLIINPSINAGDSYIFTHTDKLCKIQYLLELDSEVNNYINVLRH